MTPRPLDQRAEDEALARRLLEQVATHVAAVVDSYRRMDTDNATFLRFVTVRGVAMVLESLMREAVEVDARGPKFCGEIIAALDATIRPTSRDRLN